MRIISTRYVFNRYYTPIYVFVFICLFHLFSFVFWKSKKKSFPSTEFYNVSMVGKRGKRDLFMELPECLLFAIISFLPFKEAARTSILSQSWLKVWHSTRNIEFDESFFVNPEEYHTRKTMRRRVFIDFVQQWIGDYSESNIDKFAFKLSNPKEFVFYVQNFIAFAISKQVKSLSLDFSNPTWGEDDPENHSPSFDLPSFVYEHGGVLESLKLFACKLGMAHFNNLSLLKELSLGWMELNEELLKTLVQNSPLLESLSLTKCWNIRQFYLSEQPSSKLKKLVIDKCNFYDDPCWICLGNSPKLLFFKYSGRVGDFVLDSMRCLEEAVLDFGLEETCGVSGYFLYKLLLDLFSVTRLTICSYMLQVVPLSEEIYGTEFPLNVTHLVLNTALHSHEFYGIMFFLNSCPLLEALTINICPARILSDYEPPFEFNVSDFWTKNLIVQKCVRRKLKVVEVKGFTGTLNQHLVLQYLICLGGVMERLNLYLSRESDEHGSNVEESRERAQRMMQLRKASNKLQISIC